MAEETNETPTIEQLQADLAAANEQNAVLAEKLATALTSLGDAIAARDSAIAAGEQRVANITLDLEATKKALVEANAKIVKFGPLAELKARLAQQQAEVDAQLRALGA